MAEYALLTPTEVVAGNSIPFTTDIIKGCCNIRHRTGSGSIKIKGGNCCRPNKYYIQFHANVTGVTGSFQLGVYLDGELLPETAMSGVLPADTNVISVDTATEIAVEGCWSTISVRNIIGTGMEINTANIIIHKEAA